MAPRTSIPKIIHKHPVNNHYHPPTHPKKKQKAAVYSHGITKLKDQRHAARDRIRRRLRAGECSNRLNRESGHVLAYSAPATSLASLSCRLRPSSTAPTGRQRLVTPNSSACESQTDIRRHQVQPLFSLGGARPPLFPPHSRRFELLFQVKPLITTVNFGGG